MMYYVVKTMEIYLYRKGADAVETDFDVADLPELLANQDNLV